MTKKIVILFAILMLAGGSFPTAMAAPALKGQILAEAEAFQKQGGWALDQQFMDQMGSAYLLAHGLGRPVKDAETTLKVETAGTYKLWVRTMDWVARWQAPGAPGKFQVLVNGQAAPVTFGTEGAQWHWQDGGSVELPAGEVKLALHDLTGFEGRCDAILFCADPAFTPPNELKAMDAWRRAALGLAETPEEAGTYDLVVVGGGIAGMCAAVNAARLGLKVALLQDRAVLGGNNSSEVRVWLGGNIKLPPYLHVGDVVKELEPQKHAHAGPTNTAEIYEDSKRLALVWSERNIKMFLEYRANGVETADKKIVAVVAQNTRTGQRIRVAGKLFADCTGDGEIGARAGADFEVTKFQHMGPSNLWNVVKTDHPVAFPRCPWALDLSHKPFPGRGKNEKGLNSLGQWFWESGFDWDPVTQVEDMRDWNMRAMYGAWDALKNVDKVFPNHELNWSAYVAGKRESRRLLGDVQMSEQDFLTSKPYEDGCYPCTWSIDLHYPAKQYVKGFEGKAFLSYATTNRRYKAPYWAPYRTLYSRNIGNLFMAGRDISVTHDALGPVRVMRTCGMMGEVVGMAAAICIRNNDLPRDVYTKHLADLKELMTKGVSKSPVADVN